jgi:O-antigen/teichoic acid export membrane protein
LPDTKPYPVIADTDPGRVSSSRRDDREFSDTSLSDVPTGDVDMAAQLTLDGIAFPPPSASASPAPKAANVSAPAGRTGLGIGLTLALRFLQARFLSVWGLLLAAALCPAQVFADFAIFSALANFVSIAALLRFEAVFFQNDDRQRLGQAFRLALAAGAIFLCGMTLAILFAAAEGWVLRGFGALFMISLASRAMIRLIMAEATAEGDFTTVGNINIVQALVQPGMMILLIWPLGATSLALFAADAFGHAVAACYLLWRRRAALLRLVDPRVWSGLELRASARRWRAAPRILLPSALLSFGFMAAPLLALPLAGNPVLAAHVALAMRLLEMPTQMFATVSVPLVMSNLRGQSEERRQYAARFITLCLVAVAGVLFTAIALFALIGDFVLEGTQWQGIGQVIATLALFYGGSALVMPLHEIATLSQYPHRQLVTNAVALLAAGLAMLWFDTLSPALLCAIGIISLARMSAHVQFAWTRLGAEPLGTPAVTR